MPPLRSGRGPVIHPPGDFRGFLPQGFNPTMISGLVDWHRSDMGITLVGSKVSAWADQSGQGHDLTQGTDANRPTLVAASLGGRDVIRHGPTASNIYMQWATPWAQSADCTVYAVLRYESNGGSTQVFINSNASGPTGPRLFLAETGDKPFIQDGAASTVATVASGIVDGTPVLVRWRWGFTPGATMGVRVNNDTEATGSAGSEALDNWDLMGIAFDLASFDFIGDLAELAIYSREVSVAEDAAFRSYVTSRYGIVM